MSYHHYKPEVYTRLAETGKYFNTGKVLIGLLRNPPPRYLTSSEETVQRILFGLKSHPPRPRWVRLLLAFLLLLLSLSCIAIGTFQPH